MGKRFSVLWLILILFFHGSAAYSDCTFFMSHLLKAIQTEGVFRDQSDILGDSPRLIDQHLQITLDLSQAQKWQALSSVGIGEIVSAPGHRVLREPEKITLLKEVIQQNGGGDFSHDPVLINVITKENAEVVSVDLWDAHHRFVAYLEAGYQTIGQVPQSNIEILINGRRQSGELIGHWLPAGSVDFAVIGDSYHIVSREEGGNPGTVSIDGRVSNFKAGSRATLRQLRANLRGNPKPKIGVYFGTFDPIHEGHINVIKESIRRLGLDEVLVVPNMNPLHKPGATPIKLRLKMIADRLRNEERMNLYTGDSSFIIDRLGNAPFLERVSQIYGTKEVFQLIGQDSYEKLSGLDQIRSSDLGGYVVFPREGGAHAISVPDTMQDRVIYAQDYFDPLQLSSSLIRQKIRARVDIPDAELHPSVKHLIEHYRLYKE